MFIKSNTFIIFPKLLEKGVLKQLVRLDYVNLFVKSNFLFIDNFKLNTTLSNFFLNKFFIVKHLHQLTSRVLRKRLRRGNFKLLRKLVFIKLLLIKGMKRRILDLRARSRSRSKFIQRFRRYFYLRKLKIPYFRRSYKKLILKNWYFVKKVVRPSSRLFFKPFRKSVCYIPQLHLLNVFEKHSLTSLLNYPFILYFGHYFNRLRHFFRQFNLRLFKFCSNKNHQRPKLKLKKKKKNKKKSGVKYLRKYRYFARRLSKPKLRFFRYFSRMCETWMAYISTRRLLFTHKIHVQNLNLKNSLVLNFRRLMSRNNNRLRKYLVTYNVEKRCYFSNKLKGFRFKTKLFGFNKVNRFFRPSIYHSKAKRMIISARKRNFFFTIVNEMGNTTFMLWLGRADIMGKHEKRSKFYDPEYLFALQQFLFKSGFFQRKENCGNYIVVFKTKFKRRRLRLIYYRVIRFLLSAVYRYRFANSRKYRKFQKRFVVLRRIITLLNKRLVLLKRLKLVLNFFKRKFISYKKLQTSATYNIFYKKFIFYFIFNFNLFFMFKRSFYLLPLNLKSRNGVRFRYLRSVWRKFKRSLKPYRPRYAITLPANGLRFTKWIYLNQVRHGSGSKAKKRRRL